jgi:hypothetical protein
MFYQKYQNASANSMSINQQIATILGDLRRRLIESDKLFKELKAAQAIALGEKNTKIASSFATILSEGVAEALTNPNLPASSVEALKEIKDYFISMAILIAKFNYSRDPVLFERLVNSIQTMESTWRAKG